MELLFLAPRLPYPPDRGDKIRSFNVLRYLAAHAEVHLVSFAYTPLDLDPPAVFRDMLASCSIIPHRKRQRQAVLEAILTGRPMARTTFADARFRAAITGITSTRPIDVAFAVSSQMAQYLPSSTRNIVDFIDADSAKYEAYAREANWPMSWLYAREAHLLAAYEKTIIASVHAGLFVSAPEAALVPGGSVLELGVDCAAFDPNAEFPSEADQGQLIVFTGQMDYAPNVAAVEWFVSNVLPDLRKRHPALRLAIVGRAPTMAIRALAGDAVIVTGEVPDVRGWIAAAAVVVAPLMLARGVQNKVLEAMAMARPVVASSAAAMGIDHAGTIEVVDDVTDMVSVLDNLLASADVAKAMGLAARMQALKRYSWSTALAPLDAMLRLSATR